MWIHFQQCWPTVSSTRNILLVAESSMWNQKHGPIERFQSKLCIMLCFDVREDVVRNDKTNTTDSLTLTHLSIGRFSGPIASLKQQAVAFPNFFSLSSLAFGLYTVVVISQFVDWQTYLSLSGSLLNSCTGMYCN